MSDSGERELELLLQQLKENTDIDLRCHAAQQLGLKKTKSDIVVPALIEALNDDNWLVRVEAATALSKVGRAAVVAIEPLKDAMNEPRNRPKRGIFYEVIQTLEIAKSAEPEVEPIAVVEETPIEPVIEPSEEVIEDVVEEPLVGEPVEVVTEEIVEEAKIVDEVVVEDKPEEITEEALEDAVEDVLEDAIEDSVEETVDEEVVEEIAEEIAEEDTVGEDITEIVEDIAEEITEDTTDEEIIEEAIEEIAEEVLEDVLEEEVDDTVDHEVIDDIAEEITEEVLEKEEEEEEKTTEDITEAVPLEDVLEFEEDKKKLEEQPPAVEAPALEDVKTVRRTKALIKIVIVGDAAVGKTALRKKYSDTTYDQEYKHVLGADFATKHFSKNNEDFSMQVWDIAAKERFDKSKELFFKSIFGALLVFDVTNRDSFNNIHYWLEELRKVESKELALIIIGNKTDLRSDQESASITREEGQELASKLSEEIGFDVSYVETCAITGTGVEVAFRMLEERTTDQFFIDERKTE